MKMYLTDAAVAALRPKRKQYLVWDAWTKDRQRGADPARGLCVLVSPQGTKSFRVAFYFPGSAQPVYKHLGRVHEDVTSVEEARKMARAARASARKGEDPRAGDPKLPMHSVPPWTATSPANRKGVRAIYRRTKPRP